MWLRRERDQRGAVAVEAALITPFLCLLLFGIIEMSLLMRDAVSVNSSVRVGARIASVSASSGKGTCAASSNPPPCSPATVPALAQAAADAIQKAHRDKATRGYSTEAVGQGARQVQVRQRVVGLQHDQRVRERPERPGRGRRAAGQPHLDHRPLR